MAGTGIKLESLRPNRMQGDRILIALALSVLFHALLWGAYELRNDLHLPPSLRWLAVTKPIPPPKAQQTEQPLVFVTVANPSTEKPQNTKYYSNRNSIAANPDANKETTQPKINGKQTDVPDIRDEYRYQKSKSPMGADQHQADNAQENQQPKPSTSAGDLTLGKPEQPQEQEERPRTLKQAEAEMAKRFPTMAMKQDGGVQRRDVIPSLDVQLTGYGDYDSQLIDTIRDNWFNELDSHQFAEDRIGKVVLMFDLNSDGRISNMRVTQSTVGDLLAYVCEKAVLEGAPYQPWTENMRMTLGESRSCTFVFIYEPM